MKLHTKLRSDASPYYIYFFTFEARFTMHNADGDDAKQMSEAK